MWDLLKKADIDEAKNELALRRTAMLRRHAEESETLDISQAELQTLNKLIDVFLQKFPRPAIVSHAPISPPAAPQPAAHHHVPHHHAAGKTVHEARHHSHRHLPQTTFATYMRAASRV
jgi:hypothetical protein